LAQQFSCRRLVEKAELRFLFACLSDCLSMPSLLICSGGPNGFENVHREYPTDDCNPLTVDLNAAPTNPKIDKIVNDLTNPKRPQSRSGYRRRGCERGSSQCPVDNCIGFP
jgi:hypothetical protein